MSILSNLNRPAGVRCLYLALLACLVAAFHDPAFAQSPDPIDDARKQASAHVGAIYVTPVLLLKELGLDGNVFNQSGDRQSDFTFTIAPSADIALPIARRALLTTKVATDVVWYSHYASERSVDPSVTFRGELYARRLTFFAEGEYLSSRQRLNYEIDLRSRHVDTTAKAGIAVRLLPKVSVDVAARTSTFRFDGDAFFLGSRLRDTLDRRSAGLQVTARQRLSPLTALSVRYENVHDRFRHSPQRDTDSIRIMPGVEFKPKALVSGSAFVGYRRFSSRTAFVPTYAGMVAQLALSSTVIGGTGVGVTYDRDLAYSFELQSPYFLDDGLGVFIRRPFGERMDAQVTAARHRYRYQDVAGSLSTLEQRVDRTDIYGANIGYWIKRGRRIGFGAQYYTRASSRTLFRAFDGLRIGATATYGF